MKENICTKLRFPSNWKKLGVTSLMVFLCISLFASEPIDFDKAFKESVKIEQQIKRTSFPGKVYNIKDFGATTDTPDQPCHEQINLAITTCNQEGGGTVVIPKGTFYTGPITMKSNVNLHLEEGATLKFSTDQKLYFPGVITRWEGLDCYNARPLIYAYGESNIAITGKVMESYQYSYDKNSNIIEKIAINNYPKEDSDKVNETKSYTYDTLGRLTKTVTTDHSKDDKTKTVTYTYDNVGNRLKEDDGTTTTSYTYNGLDQLKTSTKEKRTAVDEVRQYSYDANGNQTDVKNTKTGQTESYTYDAENRLSKVAVTDKDGKTAVIQQNRYNGEGQRIQKVEGSKTTNYYYQDGVVSYTTDGENSQTSQNLIGTDGNILATQRYGSDHTDYLLYHKDIQGSTTSLVKEDGSADATYRYTDFGETTINGDNKAENEVCYTGGIYDHSTGLYYLNARYYNPEDGRFVTEDTYRGETAKPETGHLYAYCANNPVNYVDPSGHKAKTVIYYNKKGKGFKKQAMHSPYYKNSQVTFKSVIKKAQFKKEWDKIPKGTSELYLYLHGGVSCLYFDGSDMNLKELLALKKKKIKKKIVLLSCKGGIGDKNSVAKIMAKKCQCVVYASSYPYGLSYRYDKKKKVYYPRYGGKQNYYNHENPLKKYKP